MFSSFYGHNNKAYIAALTVTNGVYVVCERQLIDYQDIEHKSVRTVESPAVMSPMPRIEAYVVISGGYETVFWRYHFKYAFIHVVKKIGPECVHVSCAR